MSWTPSAYTLAAGRARRRGSKLVALELLTVLLACASVYLSAPEPALPRVDGIIEINRDRGQVRLRRMDFRLLDGFGCVGAGLGSPGGEFHRMAWWRENCTPALWLEFLESGASSYSIWEASR